jgi:hypothetical protein
MLDSGGFVPETPLSSLIPKLISEIRTGWLARHRPSPVLPTRRFKVLIPAIDTAAAAISAGQKEGKANVLPQEWLMS